MTGRLDWRRAKQRKPTESVLGSYIELRDGGRTPKIHRDELAWRAEKAMRGWSRTLSVEQQYKLRGCVVSRPKASTSGIAAGTSR
jgi:hypothetical protein